MELNYAHIEIQHHFLYSSPSNKDEPVIAKPLSMELKYMELLNHAHIEINNIFYTAYCLRS